MYVFRTEIQQKPLSRTRNDTFLYGSLLNIRFFVVNKNLSNVIKCFHSRQSDDFPCFWIPVSRVGRQKIILWKGF